jgi:hypothetical protein
VKAPLRTGDKDLIPGAQGGFHVWLKYRVRGMAPGKVKVTRTAHRVSDERALLVTQPTTQELGPANGAGYWELPDAVPSFLCPSPIGVKVVDEPVRFDVVITDENGSQLGQSSTEATPRCNLSADFCEKICNG